MKRLGIFIFSFFSFLITANAQKAGDVISGTVTDDFGPVMRANVVELDASNRIVAAAVTDMSGNFSFRLKNPKDKLSITYVGYKKVVLPFNKTHYNIRLQDNTTIDDVVITSKKRSQGSGLSIPVDEISTSQQSISMTEFEGLSMTTVDEALQGRIAGLDIVAGGDLGKGTSMRLRGVSTITGNSEPLIVVDGNVWETNINDDVSTMNEEKFAELLNVNPEDIESISVLKDAAATAIWGSQGSNGVIEIKTKRGARGATRVSYSFRLTGTYQPEGYKMLNGDEYTMMLKEEYFNPRMSDDASNIQEINYDPSFSEYEMYNNNTDWLKEVKKVGWRQNHYLSLTGGGEKAHFRIGAGYDHETGSIIEQQLDRFTSRVNLDYFVSDRIKIETNISLTYTKNKKNNGDLLSIAYNRMPNLSIYEQDKYGNDLDDYYSMLPTVHSELRRDQLNLKNPVGLAYLAKNDGTSYNIAPEFKLRYNLLSLDDDKTRLNYEGKVVFNIFNSYDETFMPLSLSTKGWNDPGQNNTTSSANRSTSASSKTLGVTMTHTLTFTPAFRNKDHSMTMMLRAQSTSGNSSNQNTGLWGLPSGSSQSTSAEGIIDNMSTGSGQWRSVYFTYSAHYAYKGRYAADFSIRRDGSTRFGEDERWGNFPALSLRWNLGKEEWFTKALPFVSMLSIRPGWGIVGRQPGSEGLFYSKYNDGPGYLGVGSVAPQNIQMKKLKWEQKETYNLGTDFGFFDDRITGNVEVYWQYTTDLLMQNRGIPTSSGFSTLSNQNVGDMKNIGWEFNLNGNRIIKKGKFSADFNITFANNKNVITAMDETCLASLNKEYVASGNNGGNNAAYLTRVELNTAFGSIYGFRYKGVYQYSDYSPEEVPGVSGPNAPVARDKDGNVILDENNMTKPMMYFPGTVSYQFRGGDAIYEDINSDGQINELDIVYLGSSLPKFTGGFGFKLNFGRLSWNNQFNFRYGNKIINQSRRNVEKMYNNSNQSRAVNWRWRVEGDLTEIPRALYNEGYNALPSDRFVEDGSFIRLNYTQVSYSLEPKVIKKWGLNQLSFYVSANNLFCLTKYSGSDPEVGYGGISGTATDNAQTPRAKSFTAGVTVQF